jgi:hypothetical protein
MARILGAELCAGDIASLLAPNPTRRPIPKAGRPFGRPRAGPPDSRQAAGATKNGSVGGLRDSFPTEAAKGFVLKTTDGEC